MNLETLRWSFAGVMGVSLVIGWVVGTLLQIPVPESYQLATASVVGAFTGAAMALTRPSGR